MRINKIKFLESLNYLKNYAENKSIYLQEGIEKAKKELAETIRIFELSLRESNSNFAQYCMANINYESIFEQIEEADSEEKIKDIEEETLELLISNTYFTSLLEIAESPKDREETEELIVILETFQKKEFPHLESIYLTNQERIEEAIQILRVVALSFGENPITLTEGVSSSSSLKGKRKEIALNSKNFLEEELREEIRTRDKVIEQQKEVIAQKDEEIERLKKLLEKQQEYQTQIQQK